MSRPIDWVANLFKRQHERPTVLCADCRHSGWDCMRDLAFCNAPALAEYRPDGSLAVPLWCADQRAGMGRCGPRANLFAPKDGVAAGASL